MTKAAQEAGILGVLPPNPSNLPEVVYVGSDSILLEFAAEACEKLGGKEMSSS